MARKHEAASLLLLGFSPSEIAEIMGSSTATVVQYLYNQVGEETIRRSDIRFSIGKQTRAAVEKKIMTSKNGILKEYDRKQLSEEGLLYYTLRDSRMLFAELYDYLSQIELFLHKHVRENLAQHYGNDRWLRKSVPLNIRN